MSVVELYGQDAEAELLAAFLPRLQHRSVVDVGAERAARSHRRC